MDLGQVARIANFLGLNGPPKEAPTVRVGVLGASQVATYALLWPARRVPKAEVVAVAARDGGRAREYAQQHGVARSYGSYKELLADPEVHAVYVGLPNGLHGQWTRAALEAGKHVLCEKPFAANEQEAREVHALARQRGLLCREAFHYREHPLMEHMAKLMASGVLGQLNEISAQVLIPWWVFGGANIRFQEALAGGAMMDAGCYCMHAIRTLVGSEPVVEAATAQMVPGSKVVDASMAGTLRWAGQPQLHGRWAASLDYRGGLFPATSIHISGERGSLRASNFVMPVFGNVVQLTVKEEQGDPAKAKTTTTSVYGSGESTYYYQLQRFVQDVERLEKDRAEAGGVAAAGRRSAARPVLDHFVHPLLLEDERDSCANMALVDGAYRAAGLQHRTPTLPAAAATAAVGAAAPMAAVTGKAALPAAVISPLPKGPMVQ